VEAIGKAAWGVVQSARAVGLLVMGVAMYRLVVKRLLPLGQLCSALIAVPLIVLGLDLPAGCHPRRAGVPVRTQPHRVAAVTAVLNVDRRSPARPRGACRAAGAGDAA
jgi:hypothetical protein